MTTTGKCCICHTVLYSEKIARRQSVTLCLMPQPMDKMVCHWMTVSSRVQLSNLTCIHAASFLNAQDCTYGWHRKLSLQIKVDVKDQEVLHNVWRDLKSNEPPKIYRLQRLAFGVNCSAFLAIPTVQRVRKNSLRHQKKSCQILMCMIVLLVLKTLKLWLTCSSLWMR